MKKFKSNYFKLIMRINGVKYGKGLSLYGFPVIYKQKNAKLSIGNHCTVNSGFLSNLVGLYQRSIIVAREGSEIILGDYVGVSGVTIYAKKRIVIGNHTNIGGNTKILDNDFHPIEAEERIIDNVEKIRKKEITIGDNVFIGCNCIILKGTVLGKNCVVGAGSVVSGVFPDNCVIAGNPAKIIKKLGEE